ncbi:MAG: hypothetical protein VKP62_04050 [Candidatus Sericytochromatia bacterium]|nr:hypothetical protein [Candidatus Sericytochromatia bacterium]
MTRAFEEPEPARHVQPAEWTERAADCIEAIVNLVMTLMAYSAPVLFAVMAF